MLSLDLVITSLCFIILFFLPQLFAILSLTHTYTHAHAHTHTQIGREKDKHLCIVLRLFCLQSLSTGGIRAGRFDGIRKLIAQTYGFRHMFTICNLEKAGLIVVGLINIFVGVIVAGDVIVVVIVLTTTIIIIIVIIIIIIIISISIIIISMIIIIITLC